MPSRPSKLDDSPIRQARNASNVLSRRQAAEARQKEVPKSKKK